MKAVAMMTPEPKYLAMKKADLGTRIDFERAARTGKSAPVCVLVCASWLRHVSEGGMGDIPHIDPKPMTKMEEMRRPMRPS